MAPISPSSPDASPSARSSTGAPRLSPPEPRWGLKAQISCQASATTDHRAALPLPPCHLGMRATTRIVADLGAPPSSEETPRSRSMRTGKSSSVAPASCGLFPVGCVDGGGWGWVKRGGVTGLGISSPACHSRGATKVGESFPLTKLCCRPTRACPRGNFKLAVEQIDDQRGIRRDANVRTRELKRLCSSCSAGH
jgi:hypothetical protein